MRSVYGLLSVILALCWVSCQTEKPQKQLLKVDQEQLAAFTQEITKVLTVPGISIGIVLQDSVYTFHSGVIEAFEEERVNDNTQFFTGSLSELMVATAMLKMQEAGQLELDEPVITHLPYFQTEGPYQQVSIQHLLTHTSGIPVFNPAWDLPNLDHDALEQTTRSIVYQPLDFAPGTKCQRAPYNYDIAADLIAKTSNRSFESQLKQLVFQPLAMKEATFDPVAESSANRAHPHEVVSWLTYCMAPAQFYPYTRENVGSFGFHASAKAIGQWLKSLNKSTKGDFWTETMKTHLLKKNYQIGENHYRGLGWEIYTSANAATLYQNRWNIAGFSGDVTYVPDEELGIIVLSNAGDDFNPTVIRDMIYQLLQGHSIPALTQPVYTVMGQKLADGATLDEVLMWCEKELQSNSKYQITSSALGQLGINLMHRENRYADALQVFQFAVDHFPEEAAGYLNLSEYLLIAGMPEAAQANVNQAIQLGHSSSDPFVSFLKNRIELALENREYL